MDWIKEGKKAHHAYHNSQAFATFTRNVAPEDAIRLFLPAENESMVMVASPLSRKRRDWIRGWNDATAEAKKDG